MANMIGKLRKGFENKARLYHGRTPGVRKLPLSAIAIILAVAFVNALTWVAAGVILVWLVEVLRRVFF